MNNRTDRINSLLQKEIGKIIRKDFALAPDVLVTVTRVETTGNLIEAKVYVSVFPEQKSKSILKVLIGYVGDIQFKINRKLRTRPVPKIIFVEETQILEADKIERIISKIPKEDLV